MTHYQYSWVLPLYSQSVYVCVALMHPTEIIGEISSMSVQYLNKSMHSLFSDYCILIAPVIQFICWVVTSIFLVYTLTQMLFYFYKTFYEICYVSIYEYKCPGLTLYFITVPLKSAVNNSSSSTRLGHAK